MAGDFDPYHRWLGISPQEQPADHYRLLGIARYESDADVISNASDQRMGHLRTFASGKHSADSQRILNEVSAATRVLLSAEKKREYDQQLQLRYVVPAPSAPAISLAAVPPVSAAYPVAQPVSLQQGGVYTHQQPQHVPPSYPIASAQVAAPAVSGGPAFMRNASHGGGGRPARPQRRKSTAGIIIGLVALGGLAIALPVAFMAITAKPNPVAEKVPEAGDSAPQPPAPPVAAVPIVVTPPEDPEKINLQAPTGSPPQKTAVVQPPIVANPQVVSTNDHRKAWFYPEGGDDPSPGVIKQLKNSLWKENSKVNVHDFREIERNSEFVALRDNTRDIVVRLYADHMDFRRGQGPWVEDHVKGRWVEPNELASLLKAATSVTTAPMPEATTPPETAEKPVAVTRYAFGGEGTLKVVSDRSLLQIDQPFTVDCWYRRTDSLETSIGLLRCGDLNVTLGVGQKDGTPATWCELNAGRWKTTYSREMHDRKWHHFGLASDGETLRVYLDGKPFQTATLEALGARDLNPVEFGTARSQYRQEWLNGELHSLGIVNINRFTTGGFGVPLEHETQLPPGCSLDITNVQIISVGGPRNTFADLGNSGVAMPSVDRKPVPSENELTAAQAAMAKVYGDQIKKAAKPEEKAKLAVELLKVAKADDSLSAAYVMLEEAKRLGIGAAEVDSVVEAVDAQAARFEIDRDTQLAAALKELSAKPLLPAQRETLVQEAVQIAQVSLAKESMVAADAAATVAATAASKGRDVEQKKYTRQLKDQISALKSSWDSKQEGMKTLEVSPNDPAANLAVGKFYALSRGEFSKAAPYLAKCDDTELKNAAEKEFVAAQDDASAVEAVEAWYALIPKLKPAEKFIVQRYVLGKCEDLTIRLTGLSKAQVDKRITELKPIVAEADKTNPSLVKPNKLSQGLIVRLLNGNNRNVPAIPTPFVMVARTADELSRMNSFDLLRVYPSRTASYSLMGVVKLERDAKVNLNFNNCTGTLAGRPIQAAGNSGAATTATMNKGTYPLILISGASQPRFSVTNAETGESLLYHGERDLENELAKLITLPTGAQIKGQLVTPRGGP